MSKECPLCESKKFPIDESLFEGRSAIFKNGIKIMGECDSIFNSRGGRLLKDGKPFIIVEPDEVYYLEVYRTIRHYAKRRGKWTAERENEFQIAVSKWCEQDSVKEA